MLVVLAACKKEAESSGERPSDQTKSDRTPPEQRTDRLTWNLKTLVNPYRQAGFANPAWDEPAMRALAAFAAIRSQVPETNGPWYTIIASNCDLAVKAGCKDPMVGYLHIRFPMDDSRSPKEVADAFAAVSVQIKQTSYPPIRKFYASLRAVEQFWSAYGTKADRSRMKEFGGSSGYVCDILRDPTIPVEEAYEVCNETLKAYGGETNLITYQKLYDTMEKPMFDKWPNDYRSFLIKGIAYRDMAWIDRGHGYANTVTEKGWEGMRDKLGVAETALERAWELNQKDEWVALQMMNLELGQGKGRKRMELWFNRAMSLDTNSMDACWQKLNYLQPKWYGSAPILLAFGRECIESKQWGGKVPLVMLDIHEALTGYLEGEDKTNYWKEPAVWLDIQDAFDRFFELNPEATGWYHNYAWYAQRCGRWDKVKQLIPKLGEINYAYFGGKEKYDEMVKLAEANADKTPPATLTLAIDLDRLNARIANKIDLGAETERDLADEIQGFDRLVAKHSEATAEDRASVLMNKAMLLIRALHEVPKGKEVLAQVKRDFASTDASKAVDDLLESLAQEEKAEATRSQLKPGSAFPEFDGADLEGKPLSIAQYKGKVLLIDFWATWCGPCVAELPNVLKTYAKYHERGFEVIGISLDDDRAKLNMFIKQKSIPWKQHFDGKAWESPVAQKYGIDAIPATFLLDGNGKIIATELRGDALETAVEKALAK